MGRPPPDQQLRRASLLPTTPDGSAKSDRCQHVSRSRVPRRRGRTGVSDAVGSCGPDPRAWDAETSSASSPPPPKNGVPKRGRPHPAARNPSHPAPAEACAPLPNNPRPGSAPARRAPRRRRADESATTTTDAEVTDTSRPTHARHSNAPTCNDHPPRTYAELRRSAPAEPTPAHRCRCPQWALNAATQQLSPTAEAWICRRPHREWTPTGHAAVGRSATHRPPLPTLPRSTASNTIGTQLENAAEIDGASAARRRDPRGHRTRRRPWPDRAAAPMHRDQPLDEPTPIGSHDTPRPAVPPNRPPRQPTGGTRQPPSAVGGVG